MSSLCVSFCCFFSSCVCFFFISLFYRHSRLHFLQLVLVSLHLSFFFKVIFRSCFFSFFSLHVYSPSQLDLLNANDALASTHTHTHTLNTIGPKWQICLIMHHLERGTLYLYLSLSLSRSLAHSCSLLTHTHTHIHTFSHSHTHTHTHTYTIHNSLWLYFSAALCYSLILTTTGSIKKLYTCECVRVCVCVCFPPGDTHTHTHTHNHLCAVWLKKTQEGWSRPSPPPPPPPPPSLFFTSLLSSRQFLLHLLVVIRGGFPPPPLTVILHQLVEGRRWGGERERERKEGGGGGGGGRKIDLVWINKQLSLATESESLVE